MRYIWRKANGEFSRPPSMEKMGVVKICPLTSCRQILIKTAGVFPVTCPRCGAEVTPKDAA